MHNPFKVIGLNGMLAADGTPTMFVKARSTAFFALKELKNSLDAEEPVAFQTNDPQRLEKAMLKLFDMIIYTDKVGDNLYRITLIA